MPNTRKRKPRKKNKVGSGVGLGLGIFNGLGLGLDLKAMNLSMGQKATQEEKKEDKPSSDTDNLDEESAISNSEVYELCPTLNAPSDTTKSQTISEFGSDQEMNGKSFVKERSCSVENFQEVTQHIGIENEPPMPGGAITKKKGKTKWTKVDPQLLNYKLISNSPVCEDTIYDAVVSEMEKYAFVAVVKENFSVSVYNIHFYPRGCKEPLQQNVPVSCFLKIGDRVKLRATKGRAAGLKGKHYVGWHAQECWQEELQETHESTPEADEVECQSTIISVDNRSVQLSGGFVIHADVMFLFGFHLAHDLVNLKDIFLPGDKVYYILHHNATKHSNTQQVAKAWYGSLPATNGDKPSHQQQFELMDFLKTRGKGHSVTIVTSVCSLNKKAEAIEDGFEKLYSDIFSEGASGCAVEKNSVLTERQLNIKKELNCKNDKKQTDHTNAWFKNRVEEEYMYFPCDGSSSRNAWTRVMNKPIRKVSLVDASTQTLATGEIVCCYSLHNSDSD